MVLIGTTIQGNFQIEQIQSLDYLNYLHINIMYDLAIFKL